MSWSLAMSCKSQNSKITQYIIDQEKSDLDYCELQIPEPSLEQCLSNWFFACKYNTRLTYEGRWYVKRWFKTITIPFTHKNATLAKADHLYWLSKNMNCPFYISYKGKFIELFNDEDAIELIMLNGDLDHYVRIYKP